MTDVYKLGHMEMYKPGTTKVYSYLCARSDKKYTEALFFGLQPYLKLLEKGIYPDDVTEFLQYFEEILGKPASEDVKFKLQSLVELGYIPLEIKAVPEGTILANKNVLATITNTHPDFHWVVGFFESLLLKVWNTTTVATASYKYKKRVTKMAAETSDSEFLIPFLVHDFGYRGVSSEETAELSGAAHLVNFCGSDTITAIKFLKENYAGEGLIGASVSASEHSIHCSFGPTDQDEIDYVTRQMELSPTGIMSVVSDAYDYWRMLTVTLPAVKDKILARDGKYVVRPDSGDPMQILCGSIDIKKTNDLFYEIAKVTEDYKNGYGDDRYFEYNNDFYKIEWDGGNDMNISAEVIQLTPEQKGTFRILDELFGSTINSKGYKELNPKIGVIYGDGMYYARFCSILDKMKEMGFATTNLVVGIGGLLLQQHNRDDMGFAIKATFATINGVDVELFKDPITDPGKRSHKGLMKLALAEQPDGSQVYVTIDQCSEALEKTGELTTVFKDGKVVKEYTLEEIRKRSSSFL
jgi:nicotinamide phosphoribosyltransferase